MKTVCLRIERSLRYKGKWYVGCSACEFVVNEDDFRSAIMAARRHISECPSPQQFYQPHFSNNIWQYWIIGCM